MESELIEKKQERTFQKRQTAYRVRVKDILDGEYVKEEGLIPNFIRINNINVSRVHLLGTLVYKNNDMNYLSMVFDDGSGKIPLRVFDNNYLFDCEVGDVIRVIGRPRDFNNEKFIVPEIIKKIDNPLWIKVREFELRNLGVSPTPAKFDARKIIKASVEQAHEETIEEDIVDEELSLNGKIIALIKKLDHGDGADMQEVISQSPENTEEVLQSMLKQGEIFEIRSGRVKVM